ADLDVVRVRAETQDLQLLSAAHEVEGAHRSGLRNGAFAIAAPRHDALLVHLLELLTVALRVHGAKEALVLERHQLIVGDQTLEGLDHQSLTLAHVIENLTAEQEVAAVDPD